MKRVGESDEDSVELDESACDSVSKPADINYCNVPCPGQCVLTEWSEWRKCDEVGNDTEYIFCEFRAARLKV